jgi:uncharacterized membrane protein
MALGTHLRNTMLAGAFAVAPVVITVVLLAYVERLAQQPLADACNWIARTVGISQISWIGKIPFLGIVLAVIVTYLVGLFVTSFLGRFFLHLLDKLLLKLPVLREVYKAWKQVTLNPPGSSGIYTKVVLVPDESGKLRMVAFCTGAPISASTDLHCVFIPGSPNPMSGRVAFVKSSEIIPLQMSIEEAFKLLISSGNFVPAELETFGSRSLESAPTPG